MLKTTKKLPLNLKIFKFLFLPAFLFAIPIFDNIQNAQAGLEFQWDQNSGYKRLKWFQKENKIRFRNTKIF